MDTRVGLTLEEEADMTTLEDEADMRRTENAVFHTLLYRAIAPKDELLEKFERMSLEDQASVRVDHGIIARLRAAFEAVIERRAQTVSSFISDEAPSVAAWCVLDIFFGRILVDVTATADVRTVQGGPGPSSTARHKNGALVVRNETFYVRFDVVFTLGPDVTEKDAKPQPARPYEIEFEGSVRVRRDENGDVDGYEMLHARGSEGLTHDKVMDPPKLKMLVDDLLGACQVCPEAVAELNQARTHWMH